jgi:hypothetical protein
MPAFRDSSGREWLVRLDGPKIKEVRSECGIDLVSLDGTTFDRLERDPALLVDCLWTLCRGQNSGVTPDQFGEALVGDAIEDACNAMLNAIADFFPSRKRSLLRSLIGQQAATRTKGLELATAKLTDPALQDKITQAMEAKLTAELQSLLDGLNTATSLPATSGSALAA